MTELRHFHQTFFLFFFFDIKAEVKSKSEFVWLVHVFYIWTHAQASVQNSLLAYTVRI